MSFQSARVFRDGLGLWTERFEADASSCLLIGGAGAISTFWPDSFCSELASSGFRAIRYDHRDAGNSSCVDFARQPYTLLDLVGDAMAILDAHGVKAAHLVGHSMGGFVAQLAAIHHPDRVLSLTSISSHTAGPELPAPDEQTWEIMLANQPNGVLKEDLPGFLKVWRFLNGDVAFDEEMAEAYTRELYARNPATLPATHHVAIQAEMSDRSAALGSAQPHALVIHGENDPLVPVEAGRQTAAAVGGSRFVTLARAGHMFFNEESWKQILDEQVRHFKFAENNKKGASP